MCLNTFLNVWVQKKPSPKSFTPFDTTAPKDLIFRMMVFLSTYLEKECNKTISLQNDGFDRQCLTDKCHLPKMIYQ